MTASTPTRGQSGRPASRWAVSTLRLAALGLLSLLPIVPPSASGGQHQASTPEPDPVAAAVTSRVAALATPVAATDCRRLSFSVGDGPAAKADLLLLEAAYVARQPESGALLRRLLCPAGRASHATPRPEPRGSVLEPDRAPPAERDDIAACGSDDLAEAPLVAASSVRIGPDGQGAPTGTIDIASTATVRHRQFPAEVTICGGVSAFWTGDSPSVADAIRVDTGWRVDGIRIAPTAATDGESTTFLTQSDRGWTFECSGSTWCAGEYIGVAFTGLYATSVHQATFATFQFGNRSYSRAVYADADL
jgi:hypothetical protein